MAVVSAAAVLSAGMAFLVLMIMMVAFGCRVVSEVPGGKAFSRFVGIA